MSTNTLFNRTVKTNIIIYPTDGMGRDGYITYNNAGFWKENIKPIVPKEKFGRPPFAVFRSLKNTPPIWTYYSDGSGRDSYVYYNNGGLKRTFSPLANQNLQKYLREKRADNRNNNHQIFHLSRDEKIYLNKIRQIQNNLVNRLYNRYKYKFQNNSFMNSPNRFGNTFNGNNNTLQRSSSQIIGRTTLEPIKYNNDNSINTLNQNSINNNFHSSSTTNIFSPQKNEAIKLKNLSTRNKNPYYYKRQYLSNSIDNKLIKFPKVKCTLEQNKNID